MPEMWHRHNFLNVMLKDSIECSIGLLFWIRSYLSKINFVKEMDVDDFLVSQIFARICYNITINNLSFLMVFAPYISDPLFCLSPGHKF